MTIAECKKMLVNTDSVKLYKIKNGVGFYSYQYYDVSLKHWVVGSFKSYSDAETLLFFSGFYSQKHYTKFVIFERKK